LLADSNLDWGQDLKALARWYKDWQPKHPGENLYLRYMGMADPSYYGIDYINMPGGYMLAPDRPNPHTNGVLAISATYLQGIFTDPKIQPFYDPLKPLKPLHVINGTIYLYPYPIPVSAGAPILNPRERPR